MGYIYYDQKNYVESYKWCMLASEHADAQNMIAIFFYKGIVVEQNIAESIKWWSLAANAGDYQSPI